MLHIVDWSIIIAYCLFAIGAGILLRRRAEKGTEHFFLAGRSLPWWLAGTSMAATTFSADTPVFVTETVYRHGIQGNWLWWSFALCHLLAVFVFASLWRRSRVLTEVEFCELRYSGKGSRFLRGFKAFFFAVPINCMSFGGLSLLAMTTILHACAGWDWRFSLGIAMGVAIIYSILSGFWGVVVTDLAQFVIAMVGAIILAVIAVNQVGGLTELVSAVDPSKLEFAPATGGLDWALEGAFPLFLGFLLVQWWTFKYADGGGILVQRMASCKNEKHAVRATIWFCIAHYALRCWPWIITGLAATVLLPKLAPEKISQAYPMMISQYLPIGLKGLMIASLLAAFMSTIDTHLNWGASYLTHDLYRRFVAKNRSEKQYLLASRVFMVILLLAGADIAILAMSEEGGSLVGVFMFIIYSQAGTGVAYLLRWFWWRVTPWTEVAAIATSFTTALMLYILNAHEVITLSKTWQLLIIVFVTLVAAGLATFLTPPTQPEQLREFYRRVRPSGPGWRRIAAQVPDLGPAERLRWNLVRWAFGILFLFGLSFAIGKLSLGLWTQALPFAAALAVGLLGLRFAARNASLAEA